MAQSATETIQASVQPEKLSRMRDAILFSWQDTVFSNQVILKWMISMRISGIYSCWNKSIIDWLTLHSVLLILPYKPDFLNRCLNDILDSRPLLHLLVSYPTPSHLWLQDNMNFFCTSAIPFPSVKAICFNISIVCHWASAQDAGAADSVFELASVLISRAGWNLRRAAYLCRDSRPGISTVQAIQVTAQADLGLN